jgi:hypothetical protein
MKSIGYRFGLLTALIALPLVAGAAPVKSTNAAAPAEVKPVFVIPTNPKEGCDPFYPKAISLYQTAATNAAPSAPKGIEQLKLVGLLGNSFATINDKNLAVGETQEVKTASGPISVHLVQINGQEQSVVVEVNGERRELKASGGGLTHP